MKKLICLLTVFVSLFFMQVPVKASDINWDISKSKTATQLDKNYRSQVTLSLPAKSEKLVSDVVFVLDKSTSTQIENQTLDMLENLQTQISQTNAKVKVGIVIFNKEANVFGWFDLENDLDDIKKAIFKEITSGTNCHAGLLAGKELLDQDQEIAAKRKYMVFVSDGITYMYNQKATVTAWSFENDGIVASWSGPDNWNLKYGQEALPDWDNYLTDVKEKLAIQGDQYDYLYGEAPTNIMSLEESKEGLNSVDKALYYTVSTYQAMKDEGYHCYSMLANGYSNYPWATSFMNYLSKGQEISFKDIQNDIYYLLDQGTYVEDFMGKGKDNYGNDYDFDFITDTKQFYMMVGNHKYVPEFIEENHYGFNHQENGYAYELFYYPDEKEHFIWKMNVPVSQFEHVQLVYTLQLINPQKKAGEYGEYDEDGHLFKEGLKTNTQAILHPIDSFSKELEPEEFLSPTVSYKVIETNVDEPEKPSETIKTEVKKSTPVTTSPVATGDDTKQEFWYVLLGLSISTLLLLLIKHFKTRRE